MGFTLRFRPSKPERTRTLCVLQTNGSKAFGAHSLQNEASFQMHKEKHVKNMKKEDTDEIIDRNIRGIKFSDRQKDK